MFPNKHNYDMLGLAIEDAVVAHLVYQKVSADP